MDSSKDEKTNSLEKLVDLAKNAFSTEETPSIFARYGLYPRDIFQDHTDIRTGARITWVSSYNLPENTRGVCYLLSKEIMIDKNDPNKRFVYHHEIGHAKGITDERLADDYALSA